MKNEGIISNSNNQEHHFYNVVIVGAGLAGLTAAIALAKLSHIGRILLVDAKAAPQFEQSNIEDVRAIALSYTSQLVLKGLGCWDSLSVQTMPIQEVHVSDKGHFGVTRISAAKQDLPALGYVVPIFNLLRTLQSELLQISPEKLTVLRPAIIKNIDFLAEETLLDIEIDSKIECIKTHIVIAADGQSSTLAGLMKMEKVEQHCNQSAIVANVGLEKQAVAYTAYERFTEFGAIAMLPSSHNQATCIVTGKNDVMAKWSAFNDADFLTNLRSNFGYRLGRFHRLGKRQSYPLSQSHLSKCTQKSVFFIGNASHTLHPIAAQGFNLGLRDVAYLVDIAQSYDEHREISLQLIQMAKKYQELRGWDLRLQTNFTNLLTRIFGNTIPFVTQFRNLGLVIFDQFSPLKTPIVNRLAGKISPATDLLLGLPIEQRN